MNCTQSCRKITQLFIASKHEKNPAIYSEFRPKFAKKVSLSPFSFLPYQNKLHAMLDVGVEKSIPIIKVKESTYTQWDPHSEFFKQRSFEG